MVEGWGTHVVAANQPAPRRDSNPARFRIALPGDWRRVGPGVARRTRDQSGGSRGLSGGRQHGLARGSVRAGRQGAKRNGDCAARTFGPPLRGDEAGSLGRGNIELLTDGSAAVSWVEFANQRSQFRVRRVEPGGGRSTSVTIAGIAEGRTSGVPRLGHDRDELLFAWAETDKGASRIRTAKASLAAGSQGRVR